MSFRLNLSFLLKYKNSFKTKSYQRSKIFQNPTRLSKDQKNFKNIEMKKKEKLNFLIYSRKKLNLSSAANLSGIIGVDACSSRGAALVNESSVSKEVGGGRGGWWSGC